VLKECHTRQYVIHADNVLRCARTHGFEPALPWFEPALPWFEPALPWFEPALPYRSARCDKYAARSSGFTLVPVIHGLTLVHFSAQPKPFRSVYRIVSSL